MHTESFAQKPGAPVPVCFYAYAIFILICTKRCVYVGYVSFENLYIFFGYFHMPSSRCSCFERVICVQLCVDFEEGFMEGGLKESVRYMFSKKLGFEESAHVFDV